MTNLKQTLTAAVIIGTIFTAKAQNIQTVKTYHDPWTKTQLAEVYTVLPNTPTKHGSYKQYDERGTLIEERNFSNGQLSGSSKTYYNAALAQVYDNPKDWYGKIGEVMNYSKGELQGNAEQYHYLYGKQQYNWQKVYDNGVMIKNMEFYTNGNKKLSVQVNGLCNEWYENGQKTAEYTYKNGDTDGQYTGWYDGGSLMIKGVYKNGNKIGKWIEYFSDGKTKSENDYNENSISINKKEFYPNGIPKSERYSESENRYKEIGYDSITGKKSYDRVLSLVTAHNELKLVKDGKEILYYSNGNKKSEATYSAKYETNFYAEKKDGEFNEWFENGQQKIKGTYNRDNKTGTWLTYYENGNKETEFSYIPSSRPPFQPVKDGESATYYSNGKIKSQGKYKNGSEIGLWTYYKEDGTLDYIEDDGERGSRFKKTKSQLEKDNAEKEYKENSKIVSEKFDKVNNLYNVTTSQVDNPKNITAPQITVYTAGNKKHIYNAYILLDNYYLSKMSPLPNIEDVEITRQRIKLLDKMIELINTDTKEMEKQLKKEEDPEKVKIILGL